MIELRRHPCVVAFVALITVSVIVGLSMPAFYAWTGSDQSRPSPLLWKVPVWSAIAAALFCGMLPWLPIGVPQSQTQTRPRLRFGLRTLLVLTAAVAVVIPAFAKFPMVAAGVVCGISFANFIRVAVRDPSSRLPVIALLACMILPYAWVVHYDELDRILPALLWMTAGLPTLYPAAIIGGLLGHPFHQWYWIAMLLTAMELTVGIWLIGHGPKRTIAYSLFALLTAAMGSLAFYQVCIF